MNIETKIITIKLNAKVDKFGNMLEQTLSDIHDSVSKVDYITRMHSVEQKNPYWQGFCKAKEQAVAVIEHNATPETAELCAGMLLRIWQDWGHPLASVKYSIEDGRVKFSPIVDTKGDY